MDLVADFKSSESAVVAHKYDTIPKRILGAPDVLVLVWQRGSSLLNSSYGIRLCDVLSPPFVPRLVGG